VSLLLGSLSDADRPRALEDAMDLREAIEVKEAEMEAWPKDVGPNRLESQEEWRTIIAAAKRELEREEKGRHVPSKVDRVAAWAASPRLKDLLMRNSPSLAVVAEEASDILKALREKVVPNLKRICALSEEIKYGPGEALSFEALKALGESP